jgi:hypothetical protein
VIVRWLAGSFGSDSHDFAPQLGQVHPGQIVVGTKLSIVSNSLLEQAILARLQQAVAVSNAPVSFTTTVGSAGNFTGLFSPHSIFIGRSSSSGAGALRTVTTTESGV